MDFPRLIRIKRHFLILDFHGVLRNFTKRENVYFLSDLVKTSTRVPSTTLIEKKTNF